MFVDDAVLKYGVGKRIVGFKKSDVDWWIILDDNSVIRFDFMHVGWSCVDCEEKKKL